VTDRPVEEAAEMAQIVVVGGGFGGLTTALLLAHDGHHVTVLERDAATPTAPEAAFTSWERRGVPQFRLPHVLVPRVREILDDELPHVNVALLAAGAHRSNRIADLPATLTGGCRPGDERFDQITGRRAMVEATLAAIAEQTDGVDVRRGVVVRALVPGSGRPAGVPHVTGVALATGERIGADLVVDCSGRRSTVPAMLETIGATRPVEEVGDAGFVYSCRHFRGAELPPAFGPPLQPYDSLSFVTIAGDNGTWSVGVMASSADTWMRRASDAEVWTRIVRSYPLIAHWIDAEPLTDVQVMARTPDRMTRYVVDGNVVATGVVAVGDAAACTSPAYGRGTALAAMQAVVLRDVLRDVSPVDAVELAHRWHDRVGNIVHPFVADTLDQARHRHAEIGAQIDGRRYATNDPAWRFGQALGRAAAHDPELLRAMMSVAAVFERGTTFARRRDVVRRLDELGDLPGLPGPTRAELVDVIGPDRAA
jgi:2-polyprenyl-6-methoxyphenol hydroxylase-like FAD-dependent oxidoreductase